MYRTSEWVRPQHQNVTTRKEKYEHAQDVHKIGGYL
jgi:hypothetical protein